jgi:hypothetical protein
VRKRIGERRMIAAGVSRLIATRRRIDGAKAAKSVPTRPIVHSAANWGSNRAPPRSKNDGRAASRGHIKRPMRACLLRASARSSYAAPTEPNLIADDDASVDWRTVALYRLKQSFELVDTATASTNAATQPPSPSIASPHTRSRRIELKVAMQSLFFILLSENRRIRSRVVTILLLPKHIGRVGP